MDLKEEKAIGGDPASHWYYISKGRAIKSLLGAKPIEQLLDVGAGSGVFSRMMIEQGRAGKAVCVDPNYNDDFLASSRTDQIDFVRTATAGDADTIIMIDVIEHVNDDVGLMREYVNTAKPGARFLISVPAFNFLWSSHDEFLEHRRRYTLKSLRDSVEAAGLAPFKLQYFFGLLFPAVAAMRLAEKALQGDKEATQSALKAAPGWLNKSLVAIHDIERAALFPLNRIAGVTAFCLAEKPAAVAQGEIAA
ncbi:MAG: class I SAM-dependent methyltransferase [Marinicaulis sp.]|nr:class I SAM-dependent methyltransferase [Marinicaulis sp.]NNL87838.1 class I SAM-dependent methyltransferase [Marinicaulis sp.]